MRASSDDTAGDSRTSGGARRFTITPLLHGRMRECEGKSKAGTKAQRAHSKIQLQYENPGARMNTHIAQKSPHLDKDIRFLQCYSPVFLAAVISFNGENRSRSKLFGLRIA
jgi:hypothetical protein